MKRNVILLTLWSILFLFLDCYRYPAYAETGHPAQGKALSLRVFQERLKAVHEAPGGESRIPEELLHLGGMTRVYGYVVDRENRDLILIGKTDESKPRLYLEDFVHALRSAKLAYAEVRDNIRYYSNPGCSIDPDTSVIRQLAIVGDMIREETPDSLLEVFIELWNTICRSPQQVRIMGVPFHSRFGRVMVEADYEMKKLVDGSVVPDIPGFASLADIRYERALDNIREGKPFSGALSINRFWFYPGETVFLESDGIALIEESSVVLLTEREFLTSDGEMEGAGYPDSLALEFSRLLTAKYPELAEKRSIYYELENLFLMFALAKVFDDRSPEIEAGLDLHFLLEEYRIPETPVRETLSGCPHVSGIEKNPDEGTVEVTDSFFSLSCGGVSIDIEVKRNVITKPAGGTLDMLKNTVIRAKPNLESLSWDFPLLWDVRKKATEPSTDEYVSTRSETDDDPHI